MSQKSIDLIDLFHLAAARAARIFATPDAPVKIIVVYKSGRREQLEDPFYVPKPAREETAPPSAPPPAEGDGQPSDGDLVPGVRASEDFRCVNFHGEVFSFTGPQAAVVKALAQALARGVPDVGDKVLLRTAGSDGARLADVFRDCPGWGVVVVEGGTRGTHRMAAGPQSEVAAA